MQSSAKMRRVTFFSSYMGWNESFATEKLHRPAREEQDILDFLDLVHLDVLVSLLATKILIGNIFFLSRFQDLYFSNLDLVLVLGVHLKILIISIESGLIYVTLEFREFVSNQRKIYWVNLEIQTFL
jgi:hypothetical protein